MHLVDIERRSGAVANVTAFSERIAVRQEVRRGILRNVTSTASGPCGAYRIDPTLGIHYFIQPDRQVKLTALGVHSEQFFRSVA